MAWKALVADDDPSTRHLLREILLEFGCTVVVAENGRLALDAYNSGAFSLVVTDWEMPEMSGIELCTRIREQDTIGYTYIIFLTRHSSRDSLIEGLTAGADDFITKPVHPDELRVRLRVANRILSLENHLRQANDDLLRMNDRLQKMSRLDPLMEIGNRLAFEEKFDEYHHKAQQEGRRFAVVMCDVDHFKQCNDRFGHQLGDDVLRQLAGEIRRRLRPDDAAFRYGGEEILILLSRQDIAGAVAAAERIRRSVEALQFRRRADSAVFRVTISCGVVCDPADPEPSFDRRELIELADRALYEAKRLGRNRVVGVVRSGSDIRFVTASKILDEASDGTQPSAQDRIRAS